MKVFNSFSKNLYKNKFLSVSKVLIFSVFVCLFCFNTVSAKPSKSKKSSSSEENNIRYGIDIKQGVGATYTIFFQYDFCKYFGWRLGSGWGYDFQGEINLTNRLDPIDKFIWYKFVPIQNSARIYPFGEDLCIAIGLELGFNPMGVNESKTLDGTGKEISADTKNNKNENYLNSTQLRFFWSVDYTTSYGLLFGIDNSWEISSFINPNRNREVSGVGTFRPFVGLDFSKWFN